MDDAWGNPIKPRKVPEMGKTVSSSYPYWEERLKNGGGDFSRVLQREKDHTKDTGKGNC